MSESQAPREKPSTRKSYKSKERDKIKHSAKLHYTAKKGGGGGKGGWGKPGDELKAEAALDERDPNWVEEDDGAPTSAPWFEPEEKERAGFANSLADLSAFKKQVRAAANDFLTKEDQSLSDFLKVLKKVDMPIYHQELPVIILKLGWERSEADRDKLLELLRGLFEREVVTTAHFAQAVHKLYMCADDLALDSPKADKLLSDTTQRLEKAGCLLTVDAEHIRKNAHVTGDMEAVKKLKQRIKTLVHEYFTSHDFADTANSLKELKAPHMNFEVVKQMLSTSFDRSNQEREFASEFLARFGGKEIPVEAIAKAFTILLERVEDLVLDVPDTLTLLSTFLARAVVDECLPPSFLVRVDLSPKDLGAQVCDQARKLLAQEKAAQKLSAVWTGEDPAAELDEALSPSGRTPPRDTPLTPSPSSPPAAVSAAAAAVSLGAPVVAKA